MRTIVLPLPHDLAVVAALEAIGKPVGFGDAPVGAFDAVRLGTGPDYLTVFPITAGNRDGAIADPYSDAQFVYQINVTGRSALGVRSLVGKIEPALLEVVIPNRRVSFIQPDDLEGVFPDRDVTPHVWFSTPRFRISTVSA